MLRSSKYKVLFINSAVFLALIILIEFFFQLNAHFHFLQPAKKIEYETTPSISAEEFKKIYGFDFYSAPEELKIKIDTKIYSIEGGQLDSARKIEQTNQALSNKKGRVELRFLPPHEDIYIYSADYVFNSDNSRRVENQESKNNAESFVLTIGDSFTFGEGVSNGYDLASQLTKKISNKWKLYNFGSSGSSTNDFIYHLEHNPSYLDSIKEKKGIVIWYFIDDQYERFFCNLFCYQNSYGAYIKYRPYYKYDGKDFIYKGSFGNSWEISRLLMQILGKSETIKYSGVAINNSFPDEKISVFAKSFDKLLEELNKKILVEKFYIVFMSATRSKTDIIEKLAEHKKLTILDFTRTPQKAEQNLSFPLDGHPTPEFYWILSEALKNKIGFK